MKNSVTYFLPAILVILLLSSCATTQPIPNPRNSVVERDIYKSILAQSAVKISHAWTQVANESKLIIDPPPRPALDTAPVEMTQMMHVEWQSGPVVPILSSAAKKAGWEFIELGSKPITTPMVSVSGTYPIIRIVEIVGSQVEADVIVDGTRKAIVLDWGL